MSTTAGRERFAEVNGKRVVIRQGESAGHLIDRLGESEAGDHILREQGGGTDEMITPDAPVKPGDRLYTVPHITKGAGRMRLHPGLALPERLDTELGDLLRALPGRETLELGSLRIDQTDWTALIVHNARINERKFRVTAGKLLFLLPDCYPTRPPIGCYLNYPLKTKDEHFTRRSYHGAPALEERGWYWYCVGIGGFTGQGRSSWRPGRSASDGHNLTRLVKAARFALNSGELH